MSQIDFDNACAAFSITMSHVANWKHTYCGAAYATRLRSAVNDARIACDRMEKALKADSKRGAAPALIPDFETQRDSWT